MSRCTLAPHRTLEVGLSGALRIVYLCRKGVSWSIDDGAGRRRRERPECIEKRVSHATTMPRRVEGLRHQPGTGECLVREVRRNPS